MRPHNRAFVRCVADAFACPSPVYEFGSYQVPGQEQYSDLRSLFPGTGYVGCDMRSGPGVDRVEDVSRMTLPDQTAGVVMCIETFEHVFEVQRAFSEVYRVLKPGGLFIFTSPFNFQIHGYPDDYWRMTPSCLRRLLSGYEGRIVGWQGIRSFPHTVMALAVKSPISADFTARADRLKVLYHAYLREAESSLPLARRFRNGLSMLYRSRGERKLITQYYRAELEVEYGIAPSLALAG